MSTPRSPRYREKVNRILASLDEDNNQDQKPETEIPDTKASDGMQDVYFIFIRENPDLAAPQVIDSVLTGEPDTNVPHAPELQAPLSADPQKQLRDEKRNKHIALLTISFFLFLCLASLAFQITLMLNPPIATIVLIPKSQTIALNATLQLGRVLSPLTLSKEQTVPTTGHGHQDARSAQGTITFYNGQATIQTIPAGTIFTGNDGIQVATDEQATIPPAQPPQFGETTVSAHTVNTGSAGNIPAADINTTVAIAVFAKNTQNFTGGQNERDFQTVAQADIQGGTAPLKTTLAQSMQGALTGQAKSGEALVTPTCTPTITADHHPGDEAEQVKVTVSETCSTIAYNTQELENKATQLLTTQAIKKLGTGYSLFGTIQISVSQATITPTTPTLVLSLQGTWVYALSDAAQEHIKRLIQGKTYREALQILQSLPGIEKVTIAWDINTKLPQDSRYIHLVLIIGI